MRKDKGLSNDLDRIPVLTWIMFVKFLDDMELLHEQEAQLAGKPFKPVIDPPYRWRDWAAKEDGITGDELIAFINQEECTRPDGTRGAGLFKFLRELRSTGSSDRRDVIAAVFRGTVNRMINGYLLRDVINKINAIRFSASEQIHTLSTFYESMLREMRDAAGGSGEFYTPRPVVRFMVAVVDPQIGETVLDPACGTGGFLVEAFSHMEKQCRTVQQRRQLQRGILGGEAKPIPYLLGQMNLVLHGLENPRIESGNSLAVALREIGDSDRVDVVLTNPPFGADEERGILSNFPDDMQTSETALLFLQLIMRKLRRSPKPGRAAVVVPHGVLSDMGVAARVRQALLNEFNVHTIVRLPEGVFAPYTPIPTNILFFDRSQPTKSVWYYEHQPPNGRTKYTKSEPLRFEELGSCMQWWSNRSVTDNAWSVPIEKISASGWSLDIKNPNSPVASQQSVEASIEHAITRQRRILETLTSLQQLLAQKRAIVPWPQRPLRELLTQREDVVPVAPEREYPIAGIYGFGRGLFARETILGAQTSYSEFFRLHEGDLVVSRVKAWEGALGVVPCQLDGFFVSKEFPCFYPTDDQVDTRWLKLFFDSSTGRKLLAQSTKGMGARRERVKEEQFLDLVIPVPGIDYQRELLAEVWPLHCTLRDYQLQLADASSDVDELWKLAAHSLSYVAGPGASG